MRWDPFDALMGAQEDLNCMFRRSWLRGTNAEGSIVEGGSWAPAVDIYETDGSLVVEAELPGIEPREISVSLDDGILTLKGERKLGKEVKEENYHRVERAYGVFQRSIRVPPEVDPDKVKAAYDNGVLTVTIEKEPPRQPRSIDVKVENKKEKK